MVQSRERRPAFARTTARVSGPGGAVPDRQAAADVPHRPRWDHSLSRAFGRLRWDRSLSRAFGPLRSRL
jgi:hypothetical protein